MLFDLQGTSNMSTIVGMLYAAVKENNERLRFITKDMSQHEIDYKGHEDKYNSTAQIIKHLTFVDLNWVYRIKEQEIPVLLQQKYGPMIDDNNRLPLIEGTSIHTLLSNYDYVMELLTESCTQLTDVDLDRVVTFGHNNEKRATIRWGIWHIADHSRYHQAQINQLRKWYSELV